MNISDPISKISWSQARKGHPAQVDIETKIEAGYTLLNVFLLVGTTLSLPVECEHCLNQKNIVPDLW